VFPEREGEVKEGGNPTVTTRRLAKKVRRRKKVGRQAGRGGEKKLDTHAQAGFQRNRTKGGQSGGRTFEKGTARGEQKGIENLPGDKVSSTFRPGPVKKGEPYLKKEHPQMEDWTATKNPSSRSQRTSSEKKGTGGGGKRQGRNLRQNV